MDAVTQEQTDVKLDFPALWGVKFLNDDYTPMDYVVAVLCQQYNLDLNAAEIVMQKVHDDGEAIVGAYPKDIAVTKTMTTERHAYSAGHPLRVKAVAI